MVSRRDIPVVFSVIIKHINLYVVEITNKMHRFAPLIYSICWLLHVSAVVCHLQGAYGYSELRENTDRYGGLSYNVVKWPVCRSVVVHSH
jgi:predicted aldo/keto reductase-like oxidoreductase